MYPTGRPELMKMTARMYATWVIVDDIMDNSTSLSSIHDWAGMYRIALEGEPAADARFRAIWELFASESWDSRVLDLAKFSLRKYLEATISIRAIEIQRKSMTVDEYFDLRRWNDAMPAMVYFAAHVDPDLREPLLEIHDHPAFEQAIKYCGIATGILLDLCNLNRRYQEICQYTNITRIIERAEGIDFPQAVARTIEYFHEFEDKMAGALDEIGAINPELSTAMKHLQGGTERWLTMMRRVGRRYGKLTPAPPNQATHT
ncbi:terpene synthase family protein [Saccharomonospora sp. NPDC046836]|uniref:terpene synthase family protein n=1 Tax=Saccharomonospora sp. NPDC046836 TaxID=3156921 RepID=UPI0033E8C806